jgi:chemosensory pili system protein ChpA (sensor histidine kinase/response regulator)
LPIVHHAILQSSVKEKPKVLIIDDSVTVRELLSMTFKNAGYLVEQAKDGEDAWQKLNDNLDIDLAFCDIEMPRLNGLDLLSRLQEDERLSKLPVAMLTSRGAQKMKNIAAQRGARGYFVKPYMEEVLLDAAERLYKGEMLFNIEEETVEP